VSVVETMRVAVAFGSMDICGTVHTGRFLSSRFDPPAAWVVELLQEGLGLERQQEPQQEWQLESQQELQWMQALRSEFGQKVVVEVEVEPTWALLVQQRLVSKLV
jgi:hypothetical protein